MKQKMAWLAVLSLSVLGLTWALDAFADAFSAPHGVPRLIPFRGHIEAGGAPVTSRIVASFEIWDADTGGNRLWGPESHTITPSGGDFTVMLGEGGGLPASVLSGGDAYVQVQIDGVDLVGRQRLASAPYALRADNGVPAGALLFFDSAACPPGWSAVTSADGRFVVAAGVEGTVGAAVGAALGDQENRGLPGHTHGVSGSTGNPIISATTGGHCCGYGSGYFVTDTAVDERAGALHRHDLSGTAGATSAGTTGDIAPYIQLRLCRRD